MKAHIQIPRGWRRLRDLELLQHGDRRLTDDAQEWAAYVPPNEGGWLAQGWVCIRRIKKSTTARNGGKAK